MTAITKHPLDLLQHIEAIRLGLIHLQGGAHRWFQGAYATHKNLAVGTSADALLCGTEDQDGCATCMWGAAHLGAFLGNLPDQWLTPERERIMGAASLRLFPEGPSIPSFNDAPTTTYEMALERYTLIYADILAHHGLPADWKLENEPCSA